MNQFGLIIQETTAGSNQQFVSDHLDINSPEIKETITDERTLASQLANSSDVYSVQITNNYKVFSLIVTNLTDFLGRSGYYAIRIYTPKDGTLLNFQESLEKIKEKYNNYTKTNSLNIQNYDDILNTILIIENDKKNYVSLKSNVNYFFYFDETNTNLGTVFNAKPINIINKLYAFNKNKAVSESIAISSGLKSLSQINSLPREISVNNHGVLSELKINEQPINFDKNHTQFYILCQSNDVVVYNTKDDKNFKTITNNFITIEKKFVPRQQPPNNYNSSNSNKNKNNQNAMYMIVGLMVLLLIGGGMFILLRTAPPTDITAKPPLPPPPVTGDTIKEIKFIVRTNETNQNKEYLTKYPKLKKYVFSFAGNKWSYSNSEGNKIMVDFYKETIDDFNLIAEEKKSFIEELEKISNHEIKDQTVTTPPVTTPPVANPPVNTPKVITPKVITPKVTTPKVITPKVITPKVITPVNTEPKKINITPA